LSLSNDIILQAFADDTTLFPSNSAEFKMQRVLLTIFENASVLVQMNKCVCFLKNAPVDSLWHDMPAIGLDVDPPIKCVYLGYSFPSPSIADSALGKFFDTLSFWKTKYLTLIGKFVIVNSYALSQLWYFMYYTRIDLNIINLIHRAIKWFLFSPKSVFSAVDKYRANISLKRLFFAQISFGIGVIDPLAMWKSLQASILLRFYRAFDPANKDKSSCNSAFSKLIIDKLDHLRFISNFWDVTPILCQGKFKSSSILEDAIKFLSLLPLIPVPKICVNSFYGFYNNKFLISKVVQVVQIDLDQTAPYWCVDKQGSFFKYKIGWLVPCINDGFDLIRPLSEREWLDVPIALDDTKIEITLLSCRSIRKYFTVNVDFSPPQISLFSLANLPPETIFALIHRTKVNNNIKSFIFKVYMNAVLIDVNNYKFKSSVCPICSNGAESFSHLFSECSNAVLVLSIWDSIKYLYNCSYSHLNAWYSFPSSIYLKSSSTIIQIKWILMWVTWLSRNAMRIANKPWSTLKIQHVIQSLISRHLFSKKLHFD